MFRRGRARALAWAFALCLAATCSVAASRSIKEVVIVFSNHLDIGFGGIGDTPGWDNAVISKYFQDHFPKAIRVANALRERGGRERLVYTTHVRASVWGVEMGRGDLVSLGGWMLD